MVATMIMANSSNNKEAMVVNSSRVDMEVSNSSLAMELHLRIRASTSSQSLGLDRSNRGLGALSRVVGEVLVEASLHLV